MQDLLDSYKETRKALKRKQGQLKESDDANRVVRLTEAKKKTGNTKTVCNGDENKSERQIIGEMIGDTELVIEWLETGRRPGSKRGIERRAAYQREKLMDPVRMQAFVYRGTAGSPANLTDWQRNQIEDALCVLSDRERECYILAHGQGFSHEYIAELLGVSKGSVDSYLSRAQEKITERLENSLFLV